MTQPEVEPWVAKTLILLKSPTEDSVEELRSMLMETIYQKYNGRKTFSVIPPVSGSMYDGSEKNKSKESKSSNLGDQKAKGGPPGGFSPPLSLVSPDSYASDSDSSSATSVMVIMENELTCAVCRQLMSSSWNQFIECAECHSLYHQQCHNPPIPDSDVRDPRVVWYCRNCTKTVSKPKASSMSSGSSSSQSGKSSSNKPSSTGRSNNASPSFGGKPFGGVSSTSVKKYANSKTSQSTSSKSHPPNINIISADRRLQNMKKKAAKKQDKRPK